MIADKSQPMEFPMLKFALAALLVFSTLAGSPAAFAACPDGYVACGETNQLCCPVNP